MNITNQKIKRIYKKAMAEFLMDNGCTMLKKVPDIVRDDHINWLFIDDDLLKETMSKFPRKQEE